jgi:DNA replication and repair protein RecF
MSDMHTDCVDVLLEELSVFQFRNFAQAELHFHQPFVCFLGANGSGKTNLLDAIHYLTFCKSYFNPADSQNILRGFDESALHGQWKRAEQTEVISCAIRKNLKKVFKRNHKEYDRLADHIGLLPAVMITPYDIDLIYEGSEIRRKFIDASISQVSRVYLENLMAYNQALVQRNNLIKQMNERGIWLTENLEPWDYQLEKHGSVVAEFRSEFIRSFQPIFNQIYKEISGGKEESAILHDCDHQPGSFAGFLERMRERDRQAGRTTAGIHRDELKFELDGFPIKKFASQGQQKSFLIALKLAQLLYLRQELKVNPILLLDDLYDKVDESRVSRLLQWLFVMKPGQVFITDTHLHRIPALLHNASIPHEVFEVNNATVARLT